MKSPWISPSYNTSDFSWAGWNGAGEMSELRMDRAPMGFYVKSTKTGTIKYFSLQRALRDAEYELVGYVYASEQFTITIYND